MEILQPKVDVCNGQLKVTCYIKNNTNTDIALLNIDKPVLKIVKSELTFLFKVSFNDMNLYGREIPIIYSTTLLKPNDTHQFELVLDIPAIHNDLFSKELLQKLDSSEVKTYCILFGYSSDKDSLRKIVESKGIIRGNEVISYNVEGEKILVDSTTDRKKLTIENINTIKSFEKEIKLFF